MAFIQYLETSINISELESVLSSPIINAVILGLLAIVLIMLAVVISKLNGNAKPKAASVSQTSKTSGGLSQEVVAAIAAAIAAYSEEEGISYRIVDIRPSAPKNTKPFRNAWAQAGIAQNTQSFR